MSGGYATPQSDDVGSFLRAEFERLLRRLSELETATGTSVNSLVDQVQEAIANIDATVTASIAANSYTQAQIDSKIASPGAIAPTTVAASSSVSAGGDLSSSGALRAMSVYSTILSSDYRAVWVTGVDGQLGHVPSSRQFKQDIADTVIDPAVVLALRLVTFRYIAAVEARGENAAVEIGLIAEEVHELGLTWLVDYDVEGNPFGVKFERLSFALLAVAQDHEARISALENS